jgi:hypothetical protein
MSPSLCEVIVTGVSGETSMRSLPASSEHPEVPMTATWPPAMDRQDSDPSTVTRIWPDSDGSVPISVSSERVVVTTSWSPDTVVVSACA